MPKISDAGLAELKARSKRRLGVHSSVHGALNAREALDLIADLEQTRAELIAAQQERDSAQVLARELSDVNDSLDAENMALKESIIEISRSLHDSIDSYSDRIATEHKAAVKREVS